MSEYIKDNKQNVPEENSHDDFVASLRRQLEPDCVTGRRTGISADSYWDDIDELEAAIDKILAMTDTD
jgi:hypothetical protein